MFNLNAALLEAAKCGNPSQMMDLLSQGGDKDCLDFFGRTPLMHAANSGISSCVSLLINAKANLNVKDWNGRTAMMFAAIKSRSDCLDLLINAGADLSEEDFTGKTVLTWARESNVCVQRIEAEAERQILTSPADGVSPPSAQPLMSAAFWGNGRCLAMLLEAGARVDATDNAGLSAAMHATSEGHADCLSLLIEAGANLSIESLSGATASSLARDGQHFDCASLIDSAIEKRALAAHVSRVAVSTLEKKRI